jgi:hypothetical protein
MGPAGKTKVSGARRKIQARSKKIKIEKQGKRP